MTQLSRLDLENISLGRFSTLPDWSSQDFCESRIIIPSAPYLFMDRVEHMDKNRIQYTCKPSHNALLRTRDHVPPGIILEFFQGYMVLADFMGCAQSKVALTHRVLGGTVIYRDHLPATPKTCFVDITIGRVHNLGKTRVIDYSGCLYVDKKPVVELRDFKAIFYVNMTPQARVARDNPLNHEACVDHVVWHDGGKFGKGLLRATQAISPHDWFFKCHFIHDPCMPGSLVLQGVFDICQKHFGSCAPQLNIDLIVSAKSHVLPSHKELVYELHVKEKNQDSVILDFEVCVDGTLAFVGQNLGVSC